MFYFEQNMEKVLIRGGNNGGRLSAKDQALVSSKLLFLKRNIRQSAGWYLRIVDGKSGGETKIDRNR